MTYRIFYDEHDNGRLYCDEDTMFEITNHMNFDDDKFIYSSKEGEYILWLDNLDEDVFNKLYEFLGEKI